MKFIPYILSLSVALILAACAKPEVIPKPENEIEYRAHFVGSINGSQIEYTENVNGMFCETEKLIDTVPGFPNSDTSFCVYFSQIKSRNLSNKQSIAIGLGSIGLNPAITSKPGLTDFTEFFENNQTPSFVKLAQGGVQVAYRDNTGKVWTSEDAVAGDNFEFTEMEQISDANGDYIKFSATFDCQVYWYDTLQVQESLTIQNAEFDGIFKR